MTLRSARIQRGLSIEQVAQDTRISARFLEALENESFDELPAPVYVRGFLRSYGNYLRLDPAPLLAQLPAALGGGETAAPAAQEEATVRRGADPFRPAAPARQQVIGEDDYPPAPVAAPDPFSARRIEPEAPLDTSYAPGYRRGGVGGVLMERGAVYEDNGRVVRVAALVGGGLVVLALFVLGAMAFGGGDGDGGQALAGDDTTPNPTGTRNPIIAGSTTAGPSPTPGESSTPGEGETPTITPETGTATPTTETEPPTATPTALPPTATPTSVPPTATPTEPPPLGHGTAFSECPTSDNGQPLCGSPITVVCPPGTWFVDYGNDFPLEGSGYRWAVVGTNGEALTAGSNGCS